MEDFKKAIVNMFSVPKEGYYNEVMNTRAHKNMGFNPDVELVNRYDPNKVKQLNPFKGIEDIGWYRKVDVPPSSQISSSGRYYMVPKDNITPYTGRPKIINDTIKGAKVVGAISGKGSPLGIASIILSDNMSLEKAKRDSIDRMNRDKELMNKLKSMDMDIHVDPHWTLREYLIKNYR